MSSPPAHGLKGGHHPIHAHSLAKASQQHSAASKFGIDAHQGIANVLAKFVLYSSHGRGSLSWRAPGALFSHLGRWPGAVRPMSALLHIARWPARAVFCARRRKWRHGADHLWPLVGLLYRSGGEKAAGSFPAGNAGAFVWHRRMQSDLQILPELGYFEIPCNGQVNGSSAAGSDCDSGVCEQGTCAPGRCDDGLRNGDETGLDCGG